MQQQYIDEKPSTRPSTTYDLAHYTVLLRSSTSTDRNMLAWRVKCQKIAGETTATGESGCCEQFLTSIPRNNGFSTDSRQQQLTRNQPRQQ